MSIVHCWGECPALNVLCGAEIVYSMIVYTLWSNDVLLTSFVSELKKLIFCACGMVYSFLAELQRIQRRRALTKLQFFLTDSCKFMIEGIICAQSVNFDHKCSSNREFLVANFIFLEETFPTA